jgi:nuclear pore complex protein Nup205
MLAATNVPKALGAGPRKPGLDPYVTFIVDAVFLRFYNRTYKDPAEKWQIAEKCLKILHLFVTGYTPAPSDFQAKDENASPGFHVMLQMNTKSEFLRLILHILDEACAAFENFTPFPGKASLEMTTSYCLQIIEKCLECQEAFFNAHFSANCSTPLAGINKLLLGMNPRTGKADHMLNVTKFVTYNSWLAEQSLAAVKILTLVMRQPNVNQQILGLFTQNDRIKNEIRQGFVECLENESISMYETEEDVFVNYASVELSTKEAILSLIQECLPLQATPNVAHYLLGFDLTKDLRLTNLQQPGVMNFPSTCTKSLVTLLDNALEVR